MQFHLNGFHEGDPSIQRAAVGRDLDQQELPSELDVLIVGSGPAGLTLAAQLAVFPQIRSRLVEAKDGPMTRGQADGVSCRSMEMFNAFGFAEQVMKEGYRVNETTFWSPKPLNPAELQRIGRVQDVEDGLSEMPHMILNQARVHDQYLELMRKSPSRMQVDYSTRLADLQVDPLAGAYPVTANLERLLDTGEVQQKTVRARYVVGCDGARSSVRTAIGRELKGDYAFQAWGVMDVLADTNFPDFRFKCIIKSAVDGNILLIPREGGYLVRLYVELDQLQSRGQSKNVSLDQIIAKAQSIFKPYSFEVKDVAWWSVYEIGHSITDKFDDVPQEQIAERTPHVFIAGDACHTHSAKAGQGMNVSMGDTFNLGWKLVAVLTGQCAPELLHSYSAERQCVAQDLIDFDHRWARIISAPSEPEQNTANAAPLFQKYFVEHGRFTAGLTVKYKPSQLVGSDHWQQLARGFEIGTRLHSAPVIRLADAMPMQLAHTIQADARWHLFAFAGAREPLTSDSALTKFCEFFAEDSSSPLHRFTAKNSDIDSVFSVYGIFQQGHRTLDFECMPNLFKPRKGRYQVKDYEKVFCADLKSGADIFDLRGIDREHGCLVVVRPDQYVATVLPLDAFKALSEFFAKIFLQRS